MAQIRTVTQGIVNATAALCVALVLAGCLSYKDPEEDVSHQKLFYSFNPQTILSTIDKGEGLQLETWNVFPTPQPSSAPANWNQDDFYQVAVALIPPDLADRTYLYNAGFWGDCRHSDQGITSMHFKLSTRVDRQHSQVRSELHITVNAREGWASVYRWDLSPAVKSYGLLDLSKMKVQATQALHLAEELAGRAYRQEVENRCYVSGVAAIDSWWLMYSQPIQNVLPDLKIQIFQSGEAKVVRQRK